MPPRTCPPRSPLPRPPSNPSLYPCSLRRRLLLLRRRRRAQTQEVKERGAGHRRLLRRAGSRDLGRDLGFDLDLVFDLARRLPLVEPAKVGAELGLCVRAAVWRHAPGQLRLPLRGRRRCARGRECTWLAYAQERSGDGRRK